jgi:Fe-S-cluster-containing hydrogenase component 2
VNKVSFETEGCVGCRTCQLACSYHHKGVFMPSASSIEIKDQSKDLGFEVSFYTQAENGHLACDQCQGLEEPLCVEYCNVLMRDELWALLNRLQGKS